MKFLYDDYTISSSSEIRSIQEIKENEEINNIDISSYINNIDLLDIKWGDKILLYRANDQNIWKLCPYIFDISKKNEFHFGNFEWMLDLN